ncbi:hypothetical protein KC207_02605 [Phycicoccus sp. BSK3Z-2]|uniref:Uncharacterized protein n=1 Tax=Phycicoccus avicenniae TaxID=2828860 RepID=A0A941D5X3_9MICO|nr:hypothetical protein [Phycicoccus avicenniae]MBR7742183.1 hypothetical protein [Phycicoccus avicenniae]
MTNPGGGPAPGRRTGARRRGLLVALPVSLLVTAWVLRGIPGPGQYLVRDFVAVPDPARPVSVLPSNAETLRAWPLDAVVWLLSGLVPTGVQQALILAGALVLAGTGAGLLVSRAGVSAVAATSVLAVWNPYVTERVLLGQPPTLLGYAMLPWVLLAVRSARPLGPRLALLVLAAAPAALTPWGGALALAVAVVGALSRDDRGVRQVAATAAVGLAWCLPWAVPAVLAGGLPADPDGAAAFALADDSGLGTWLSALTGGGVWGSGAVPRSREDPVALGAGLVLVVVATVGAAALGRRWGWRAGLVALGLLVGPSLVLTALSGPLLGVLAALQSVPGVALVRDQHRVLAPAVLALAVLAGVATGAVRTVAGRAAGALVAALVLALAVAAVPDLPRSVGAAYRPVTYPAGWEAVVSAVDRVPGRPVVASFPWQPLRRPGWGGPAPFLDPLPRALSAEVLVDGALVVERDGRSLVVGPTPGEPTWRRGVVTTESLRERGVDLVVEWLDTPGALPAERPGWVQVVSTPELRLWDVRAAR